MKSLEEAQIAIYIGQKILEEIEKKCPKEYARVIQEIEEEERGK